MHAWQFTPSSFQLILLELARMRHLDWAVEDITPATGCEFCVRLRRGGIEKAWAMSEDELGARRLALLQGTVRETGEQARFAADDFRGTVAT